MFFIIHHGFGQATSNLCVSDPKSDPDSQRRNGSLSFALISFFRSREERAHGGGSGSAATSLETVWEKEQMPT